MKIEMINLILYLQIKLLKYSKEDGKLSVPTLRPDENGQLKVTRLLEKTKDYIAQYLDDNGLLDKYFRKFGKDWKQVDEEITKEKVKPLSARIMYLEGGQMINRFLRSGNFYNFKFRNGKMLKLEEMPKDLHEYLKPMIKESMDYNRQIIDCIDDLDKAVHSSRTSRPMTVYRDVPYDWLNSGKGNKLIDRGYFSTSVEPGASMEGLIGSEPKIRVEVELDKGTPFLDLTYTTEKEMLLPRNLEFLKLGENRLKCLGEIKE